MRKLPPTLRLKRRYLLVEADKKDIEKSIIEYIGILGWAKAAPLFSQNGKRCVVAVNREELVNVRAALALSNIDILRVSGTLKGLE